MRGRLANLKPDIEFTKKGLRIGDRCIYWWDALLYLVVLASLVVAINTRGDVEKLTREVQPIIERGQVGPRGERGLPGKRIVLRVQKADGSIERIPVGVEGEALVGKQGPRGPRGRRGAVGPAGPRGPRGEQGERGPRGFQGAEGVPGVSPALDALEAQVDQLAATLRQICAQLPVC